MDKLRVVMLCILVAMFALAGLFLFGNLGPSLTATLKLIFGLLGLTMAVLATVRLARAKKKAEAQNDAQKKDGDA